MSGFFPPCFDGWREDAEKYAGNMANVILQIQAAHRMVGAESKSRSDVADLLS